MNVYRVTYLESERGWGQNTFTVDYLSRESAEQAIINCNRDNADDWQRTGVVPDYYIQPYSDHIEVIEIDAPVAQRTERDPAKVEAGSSNLPGSSISAWTDYPFSSLGDEPYCKAPVRECEVVSYDADKYVKVMVEGVLEEVKRCYVYSRPGRCGEAPTVPLSDLKALPREY